VLGRRRFAHAREAVVRDQPTVEGLREHLRRHELASGLEQRARDLARDVEPLAAGGDYIASRSASRISLAADGLERVGVRCLRELATARTHYKLPADLAAAIDTALADHKEER
jgi:hypothetical protein